MLSRKWTVAVALGLATVGGLSTARADDPTPPPFVKAPTYTDATVGGYSIDPVSQTFTFNYSLSGPRQNGRFGIKGEASPSNKKLAVKADAPAGYVIPDKLQVTFEFNYGANGVAIEIGPFAADWKKDDKAFVVGQDDLQKLAESLVAVINANETGFDSYTPVSVNGPVTLKATPVITGTTVPTMAVPIAGLLKVEFKQVVQNPPPYAASQTPGASPQAVPTLQGAASPDPMAGVAIASDQAPVSPAAQSMGASGVHSGMGSEPVASGYASQQYAVQVPYTVPVTTYQQQTKQVTENVTEQVPVEVTVTDPVTNQVQKRTELQTQTKPVTKTVVEMVPVTVNQTQIRTELRTRTVPVAASLPEPLPIGVRSPLQDAASPEARTTNAGWRRTPSTYLKGQATSR